MYTTKLKFQSGNFEKEFFVNSEKEFSEKDLYEFIYDIMNRRVRVSSIPNDISKYFIRWAKGDSLRSIIADILKDDDTIFVVSRDEFIREMADYMLHKEGLCIDKHIERYEFLVKEITEVVQKSLDNNEH